MEEQSIISIDTNSQRIRLNLGSGGKKMEGAINVDSNELLEPDLVADIRDIASHFGPESVDEIFLFHTLEHLSQKDGANLLQDCFNILNKGGVIVIECPDIMKCAINLLQAKVGGDPYRVERFGLFGIYGFDDLGMDREEMQHRWGYWPEYLGGIMDKIGFSAIQDGPAESKSFAAVERDFRIEGLKF